MKSTWQSVIEHLRPYIVRISTPQGSGTGFLFYRPRASILCGIATAAHVIDHAHSWEQPIRFIHFESGKSVLVRHADRAVFLDKKIDTSVIVMSGEELPFPKSPPTLTPERGSLKVGIEVGWLGFPAVSPDNLCFFSGRNSCYLNKEHAYLVDGVAINGVSGGPTFFLSEKEGNPIIGVVTAYIANRVTGETLPGLAVVRDVSHFQDLLKKFKSIEEAKKNESPPENLSLTPEADKKSRPNTYEASLVKRKYFSIKPGGGRL